MSQFYELTTQGTIPVLLDEAKAHLKIPLTNSDDDELLILLLEAAAEVAEKYTRRDLRANTWTLFLDEFPTRICLRRDPVASIASIKFLDDSPTPIQQTVATTVYYLKKGVQASEVLLQPDQEWPDGSTPATTVNEREHSIEVAFVTEAHACLEQAKVAILRHVAFLYENRGDCDPTVAGAIGDALNLSGAAMLLDQIRVSRV